jgi:hypothetical protein
LLKTPEDRLLARAAQNQVPVFTSAAPEAAGSALKSAGFAFAAYRLQPFTIGRFRSIATDTATCSFAVASANAAASHFR